MNELLFSFMNYWNMFFMNVFLIDDGLDVFMNDRSVMFVDHILVNFLDYILVVLMDYVSFEVLDNWLLHMSLDNRCFLMRKDLSSSHILLKDWSFFMSDHSRR